MNNYETRIADLQASGIHSILTQFCDLHGVAKGKLVPLQNLREWVETGAGFAGPSIWGTGLGRFGARSEYYGRVQPESLRPLPFMPGVAHAVCDGYAGGLPLDTDSRQLLKRQLARLKERGWTLWVGIEPEFFLLKKGSDGRWLPADGQDRLDKPSYDLKSIHRNQGFLDDMRVALTQLGFELQQIDHEDACGQYEINYSFDDALAAADRFMLFKLTAHAIAEQHGCVFSCMPKPFAGAPGSGLHFHLSITDEQGRAVFTDSNDALQLSAQGYGFVAGLLQHADALTALCAPTVNSYKRLALSHSASGTTWSPVWKAYGDNNRTCVVRTVAGRLEWRLPDPSCNVYAAIAATLAAGLDGIDRALPVPTACNEDLYERFASGAVMPERLPVDLGVALQALARDTTLTQTLGEAFCQQFITLKTEEWLAYVASVSDWELQHYVDQF
ncbi:type III glutamate--ammonia ligase [Rhodoferax fermentans]|uniref:Type III glutamate--ammonia ligase n=1 Tax=Rhodoferax fermentans TaxID=28066 RepID=A0A1T1AMS4_RHOFE|nr:type III glutamate--ammonia ligase [Rhodoferax fermentans]MBK1683979.1 type III glutamate--ammonia ligase [Rhodoferax fermentans]OOV05400.1 type III glutamate--ammonia ligase [Rhodoferax fermentans]